MSTDDLIERLRSWEAGAANRPTLYDEAADHIDHLYAEIEQQEIYVRYLESEVDQQQAMLRACADRIIELEIETRRLFNHLADDHECAMAEAVLETVALEDRFNDSPDE